MGLEAIAKVAGAPAIGGTPPPMGRPNVSYPPEVVAEGFGWIVPSGRVVDRWAPVRSFQEKPAIEDIRRLARLGALINTFVMVGQARTFADLCADRMPAWWRALAEGHRDPARLDVAYEVLPPQNFSRSVLERVPHRLLVPLGDAGWSDVGTPERLLRIT